MEHIGALRRTIDEIRIKVNENRVNISQNRAEECEDRVQNEEVRWQIVDLLLEMLGNLHTRIGVSEREGFMEEGGRGDVVGR